MPLLEPVPVDLTQSDEHRRGELSPQLVRLLPHRDPVALEAFFDLWFERVHGFVRRMVGEEHLAEDLTQEIFLTLHQAFPSYDPARALKPWVFTIATNKVRDHWRSRRHQMALREIELHGEERGEHHEARTAGPREELERAELGRILAQAVAELPEFLRTTLILRWYEGLSFEEIGRIVDRNEVAVRKRFSRSLASLREALGARLYDPESER